MQTVDKQELAVATLAGGCYWCLEAPFRELYGVEEVISGFMGGHVPDPTYEQVCRSDTGHAEVVRVTFDPVRIAYRDLLEVFFALHDPTTLNRQGHDIGTQYRSAVFYHDEEQRRQAEAMITQLTTDRVWDAPIVTAVVPAQTFYPAGDDHQRYFERNPFQPYCMAVVAPKVARLRSKFAARLKRAG